MAGRRRLRQTPRDRPAADEAIGTWLRLASEGRGDEKTESVRRHVLQPFTGPVQASPSRGAGCPSTSGAPGPAAARGAGLGAVTGYFPGGGLNRGRTRRPSRPMAGDAQDSPRAGNGSAGVHQGGEPSEPLTAAGDVAAHGRGRHGRGSSRAPPRPGLSEQKGQISGFAAGLITPDPPDSASLGWSGPRVVLPAAANWLEGCTRGGPASNRQGRPRTG